MYPRFTHLNMKSATCQILTWTFIWNFTATGCITNVMTFSFWSRNIPISLAYGVFFVRCARICFSCEVLSSEGQLITSMLLSQEHAKYRVGLFPKFYMGHHDLIYSQNSVVTFSDMPIIFLYFIWPLHRNWFEGFRTGHACSLFLSSSPLLELGSFSLYFILLFGPWSLRFVFVVLILFLSQCELVTREVFSLHPCNICRHRAE